MSVYPSLPLRWATLALLLFSIPSCVTDEDDTIGTAQAESVVLTPIDIGYGHYRYQEKTCGKRCVKYSLEDLEGGVVRWCTQWQTDCGARSSYVGLFENATTVAAGTLFEEHPQANYLGCGPKAAQNVLRFYGLDITLEAIRSRMTTYDIPFSDEIATLPEDLASGLERMLNEFGDGDFVVRTHSDLGSTAVKAALADAAPVIILAHGGTHYEVATGYWGEYGATSNFHVIDYVGDSREEDDRDLEMDFDYSIPGTSYQSGTIITIEHSNPVCGCKPGERRSCGRSGDGRQYCPSSCQWSTCTYPNDGQVPSPPTVAIDYLGCSWGTNSFVATVAKSGVVDVTSLDKQYRIGSGSWMTLSSSTVKAPSRTSVSVRGRACNSYGCSGYASKSMTGPYCSRGLIAK